MGERELLQQCLGTFESIARDVAACGHLDDDWYGTSICTQLREHLAKPKSSVFQRLYENEINFAVSSFWDGGFTVKLGDEMNGFKAEACMDTMQQAEAWLEQQARVFYPRAAMFKATPAPGHEQPSSPQESGR